MNLWLRSLILGAWNGAYGVRAGHRYIALLWSVG